MYYRVPQLKLYNSRRLFFHLINKFLMFKIYFHILQTCPFYDISSFFDLSYVLFHKLVFFKFFFSLIFFSIFFPHLVIHKLMSKIYFHILQTCPFYDISSFFDLSYALFHKSVFLKKKFFFQKIFKFFLKIFCLKC